MALATQEDVRQAIVITMASLHDLRTAMGLEKVPTQMLRVARFHSIADWARIISGMIRLGWIVEEEGDLISLTVQGREAAENIAREVGQKGAN